MAVFGAAAIEPGRLFQGNRIAWLNEFKLPGVRLLLKTVKRLVAHGHSFAPVVDVIVVVFDLFERTAIDDGLVAFEARPLFPFVRDDRDRAELDPLDCSPRLGLTGGDARRLEPLDG